MDVGVIAVPKNEKSLSEFQKEKKCSHVVISKQQLQA